MRNAFRKRKGRAASAAVGTLLVLLMGFVSAADRAVGGATAFPGGRSVPDITPDSIGAQPPGWYELRIENPQPTDPAAVSVYWMPRGTYAHVPSIIRAFDTHRAVVEMADPDATGVMFFQDGTAQVDVTRDTGPPGADPLAAPPPSAMSVPDYPFRWYCSETYLCLHEHNNWGGNYILITGAFDNDWVRLSQYGFNDKTSPWINFRVHDSKLSEHWPPDGYIKCLDENSYQADMGWFNDHASGARRRQVSNDC